MESLKEQIEERYISGDFARAYDLCYAHLQTLSNPVPTPSFHDYKPLLQHTCSDNQCGCEHFLSLAAQFMFELRFPPDYILAFLTNFYYQAPQLPLVCVGLVAGMFIHQQKYKEAQEMLEQRIRDTKRETEGDKKWGQAEVEKYYHLLALLILHVLLPQGKVELARAYLENDLHPAPVQPLSESFKAELLNSIKQCSVSSDSEVSRGSDQEASTSASESNVEQQNSTSGNQQQTFTSASKPAVNSFQLPSGKQISASKSALIKPTVWKRTWSDVPVVRMLNLKFLISGTATVVLILVFVIGLRKRNRRLLKLWDGVVALCESAFSPNNSVRRLQRAQQRQQLV